MSSYLITAILVLDNFLIDERDITPIDVDLNPTEDANDRDVNGDEDIDNFEQGGLQTHNIPLRHMYWLNSR